MGLAEVLNRLHVAVACSGLDRSRASEDSSDADRRESDQSLREVNSESHGLRGVDGLGVGQISEKDPVGAVARRRHRLTFTGGYA